MVVIGCGSPSLRTELLVSPNASRASVQRSLARHNLCLQERDLSGREEIYRRCAGKYTAGNESPGMAVVIRYGGGGRMITLQRFERFATRGEARTRFDELASARTAQVGSPSEEAKQYYTTPPPEPVEWRVWYGPDRRSLISLSLFAPDRDGPDLVEDIVVLGGR